MPRNEVHLILAGLATTLVGCGGPSDREEPVDTDVGVTSASLTVPEGALYQLKAVSSGKCANVQGASTADGAKIVLWPCTSTSTNDRVDLVNVSGDVYQARPTNSGKCIVVSGNVLVQQHCSGAASEQFRGVAVSGGVHLVAQQGGGCVSAPSNNDGTQLTVATCSNAANQTFSVSAGGTVRVGDPIPGLGAANVAAFTEGRGEFEAQEGAAEGLGPLFNDTSCGNCHNAGATGGGSTRIETRFGRTTRNGNTSTFDPLASLGGSLRQDQTIGTVTVNGRSCNWALETVPTTANTSAGRRTTPLFGLGLVDLIPDATFTSLASSETQRVRGKISTTTEFLTGRTNAVGKFGWKGQNPTLFQFSGDAYLFEMGITNQLKTGIAPFGTEQCPNGVAGCAQLNTCDPVPGIDDEDDDPADGVSDGVAFFATFMKFLNPPPRGNVGAAEARGESVFSRIGCNSCHTASFTTPNSASVPDAMRSRTIHPYSDFLLHDMDGAADQIVQGAAGARDMRTAPLWGLRFVSPFLHDGRATTIAAAIQGHRGQGQGAADSFGGLGNGDRSDLLAFLNSL
jgi:cytochrome c553